MTLVACSFLTQAPPNVVEKKPKRIDSSSNRETLFMGRALSLSSEQFFTCVLAPALLTLLTAVLDSDHLSISKRSCP